MKRSQIIPIYFIVVLILFRSTGYCVYQQQEDLNQKLLSSVKTGDINEIRELLDDGASVDAKYGNGISALFLAISNRNDAIVKLLLERGADIGEKNTFSPLILAAYTENLEIIKQLLDRGAEPNVAKKSSWTYVMYSATIRNEIIFPFERKCGSLRRKIELSPLLIGTLMGNLGMVQLLLNRGADVNYSNCNGWTALNCAVLSGKVGIIHLLLETKTLDINCKNWEGKSALDIALECGRTEIAKILINHGINIKNQYQESSVIKFWRKYVGPHPNYWTTVSTAVKYKNTEILHLLLDRGMDPNEKDDDGWTLLMEASNWGKIEMMNLLLENGAEVNLKDKNGWTALMVAATDDDPKTVETLLKYGADLKAKNNNNKSALFYAKKRKLNDVIKILRDWVKKTKKRGK